MKKMQHNRLHIHLAPVLLSVFIVSAVALAAVTSGSAGMSLRFRMVGEALFKGPFGNVAQPVADDTASPHAADAARLAMDTTSGIPIEKPVRQTAKTGVYQFN